MRSKHAVSKRIENAMAEHRENARQRRMAFLERAAREPGNHDRDPLPEADRERLKQAYRDAADRRRAREQDRRRNRGRDDR